MDTPDGTLLELWAELGDIDVDDAWNRFQDALNEAFPVEDNIDDV